MNRPNPEGTPTSLRSPLGVYLGAFAALAAVGALYLSVGSGEIDLGSAIDLFSDSQQSSIDRLIFWEIRMPRLFLAACSGAALALAGLLLQTYFANPMADSYVIGASSGATLGAILAMLAADALGLGHSMAIPPTAFLFSLVTLGLVYRLSVRGGRLRIDYLLLTGIAVSLFCSALASLIMIRADDPLHGVVFWLLGSFGSASWNDVLLMAPILLLGAGAAYRNSGSLNLLLWGDETAQSMGVPVRRVRWIALATAALLTALSVSLNGVIAFVGLIVPHISRFLVGANHGTLIPTVLLLGASTLVSADFIARVSVAPGELPIGIVTALLGVPFFIALMRRSLG